MKKLIKTKNRKLNADEKMTPYMEKWIAKVEKDIKAGKNMSGPFHSVEELRKHLEK